MLRKGRGARALDISKSKQYSSFSQIACFQDEDHTQCWTMHSVKTVVETQPDKF